MPEHWASRCVASHRIRVLTKRNNEEEEKTDSKYIDYFVYRKIYRAEFILILTRVDSTMLSVDYYSYNSIQCESQKRKPSFNFKSLKNKKTDHKTNNMEW